MNLIEQSGTSSVTRHYSDMRPAVFLAATAFFAGVRTAVQHPFTVCLAIKQTSPAASALSSLGLMQHVVTTHGVVGLTRGLTALSVGTAVSEVVYFWIYERLREMAPQGSVSGDGASGYVADALSRLIFNPAMVIAYRQIGVPHIGVNSYGVSKQLFQEKGVRGFYTGMGLTLLIGCQWTAAWWALYQKTKTILYSTQYLWLRQDLKYGAGSRLDNPLLNAASSIVASTATATVFNPFMVVRTRLQMQPHASIRGVVKDVVQGSGWRGFFHGTMLSTVLCIADGLIVSLTYEYAKMIASER